MNRIDYVVFDLETTGVTREHEAVEVAAAAYDCRSLEKIDEFRSHMRPLRPELADERALRANGLVLDELKAAPHPRAVWPRFVRWVERFNRSKTKAPGRAPVMVGMNRKFDLSFAARLNALYAPKKKKTVLFNRKFRLELMDLLFLFFEDSDDLGSYGMDSCRRYFGLSHDGAHSALVDVLQTAELAFYFLRGIRAIRRAERPDGSPLLRLKGALAR